jgi:hypothetical protein
MHSQAESRCGVMTDDRLTAILVERIMGWKACPDRFLRSSRSWIPRQRFRPFEEFQDAFRLLDRAKACFCFTRDHRSSFTAHVQIGGRRGKASGALGPRTITTAIVLALGLEA